MTIAESYKNSYKIVFDKLDPWKKKAINEDIKNKEWESRFITEFVKDVIISAELEYDKETVAILKKEKEDKCPDAVKDSNENINNEDIKKILKKRSITPKKDIKSKED